MDDALQKYKWAVERLETNMSQCDFKNEWTQDVIETYGNALNEFRKHVSNKGAGTYWKIKYRTEQQHQKDLENLHLRTMRIFQRCENKQL